MRKNTIGMIDPVEAFQERSLQIRIFISSGDTFLTSL
jgi:hypothetical protein